MNLASVSSSIVSPAAAARNEQIRWSRLGNCFKGCCCCCPLSDYNLIPIAFAAAKIMLHGQTPKSSFSNSNSNGSKKRQSHLFIKFLANYLTFSIIAPKARKVMITAECRFEIWKLWQTARVNKSKFRFLISTLTSERVGFYSNFHIRISQI